MGRESLYNKYHVTYNGIQDSTVGVHIASRPSIPAAREVINTFTIPGRDGTLTVRDGTVEDIAITVDFSYSEYPDEWQDTAYAARDWLLGHANATLRFSDLSGIFYKVKYVELSETSRQLKKTGTFSAIFHCEGYQYLDSGLVCRLLLEKKNKYATAHPIYNITASTDGTCTLTVGGKSITATVAQNLTIDTDRMIAYRVVSGNTTISNTALMMGNYDFKDLWLKRGSTSVSVTGSGFALGIIPNWRRI